MAVSKKNSTTTKTEKVEVLINEPAVAEVSASAIAEAEKTSAKQEQPSMADLMAMFASMKESIDSLKTDLTNAKKENEELKTQIEEANAKVEEAEKKASMIPEPKDSTAESTTNRLLDIIANRKSEKEVVLIHNREIIGGGSTAIRLTGLSIDFHTFGEQRLLSWQQFEECVSKYRRWFDKEIIVLGPESADIAERYNVPCLNRDGKRIITKEDLRTLYRKPERELEDFYQDLTDEDKDFICSYWLGKCYSGDQNYINRGKIEILNRLNPKHPFTNYIVEMNFKSIQ